MQKYMSKSEVRCASLMNNVLEENINKNEILEKISFVNMTLLTFIIFLFYIAFINYR